MTVSLDATIGLDCRKIADYGIGSYVRGLLQGFSEAGSPERLLVLGGDAAGATWAANRPHWSHRPEPARPYSVAEQIALPRRTLAAGADLWHFPHYVTPLMLRAPMVVTVHDLIHIDRPQDRSPFAYPYALLFATWALTHARVVITASRAAAERLLTLVPEASPRLRVIPHGLDPMLLAPPSSHERARARELVSAHGPMLLYVGNDLPHKNVDSLVRALPALRPLLEPDGRLVLAGVPATPDRPWARAARDGGVAHLVTAPGRVDMPTLRALYAEADLFVFPSRAEGFGLPPLEAMAQGARVLVAALPVLREVLGEHADYFDADDPGALAVALATLLTEPRDDGAERRRRHATTFTWRRAAEATILAYREALGD